MLCVRGVESSRGKHHLMKLRLDAWLTSPPKDSQVSKGVEKER